MIFRGMTECRHDTLNDGTPSDDDGYPSFAIDNRIAIVQIAFKRGGHMKLVKLKLYDSWATCELDGPREVPDAESVVLNIDHIVSIESDRQTKNFRDFKSKIKVTFANGKQDYHSSDTVDEIYEIIREQANKSASGHWHDHQMASLERQGKAEISQ